MKQPLSVPVFSSLLLLSALTSQSAYAETQTPPAPETQTTAQLKAEPAPIIMDGFVTTNPTPPPVIVDGSTPTAPVEPPPVILDGTPPIDPVEPPPVIVDGTTPTDPVEPPPVILDGAPPIDPVEPPPVILDGTTPTEPTYQASYELSEFVAGEEATVTATINGDGGFLQGWVDWNGDGDYLDDGEKISTNAQDNITLNADQTADINNNNGKISISVTVPADATLAPTTALFHWAGTTDNEPNTIIGDGEAEELSLTIQAPDTSDPGTSTPPPISRQLDDEGLEYTIRWNPDDSRYHIYMKPTVTPEPNLSLTGQITIRVPHATGADQFNISNLTSTVPNTTWNPDSRSNAPTEASDSDYLSLSLTANSATAFNWQAGQEIEVFNFTNSGACLGSLTVMDNATDPFNAPLLAGGTNSTMTNPGNQFNNLGWNEEDVQANNYVGNYGLPADCSHTLDSDNDGISDTLETTIGSAPDNPDTDGDGVGDALEAGETPETPLDTDSDGIADILDEDDDNDGLYTLHENYNGGAAADDDTDQDGIPDFRDPDDDGDGILTAAEQADPNGNGDPADAVDLDNDSIPSYLDADEIQAVSFSVRGILQGAYNSSDGLMRDDLNQQNLIPVIQPFADSLISLDHHGEETVTNAVLELEGDNAPVDWVLVELLDASDRESRVATQAAILQRDGDVVDATTGSTSLSFPDIGPGDYYVGLNHRNHLAVVTLDTVALTPDEQLIDFTSSELEVYGDNARYEYGGLALLWGGEADNDNSIICNGPGNDVTALLSKVLTGKGNALFNGNFRLSGYSKADFNLDGLTLFAGPDNDSNIAMGNVLLHPQNSTFSANFVVRGRKPKHKWPLGKHPGKKDESKSHNKD